MPRKKKESDAELERQEADTPPVIAEEPPVPAEEQEPVENVEAPEPVAEAGVPEDAPPAPVGEPEPVEDAEAPEPVAAEGVPEDVPPAPVGEPEPVEDAEASEPVAEAGVPEDELPAPAEEPEPVEDAAAPVPAPVVAAGVGLKDRDAPDPERRKRRRLAIGLSVSVVLLVAVGALFAWYLLRPGPLPDLLPDALALNYRPHYLFSFYGVEQPSGVAVSPDGERIYVTETGGERQLKIFDRQGSLLDSFAPPYTGPAERVPVYVAVDPAGRVFVTDRMQRAVFVYDRAGTLLDAILGPDLTLSEYLSKHLGGLPDSVLAYNLFEGAVYIQREGEAAQLLAVPNPAGWAPLGVRIDGQGTLLLTNVAEGHHTVHKYPAELISAGTWQEFAPPAIVFGVQGQGSEELLFPNSAVADSQGRIYVTDGNNGRISVWDSMGGFLFTFGRGVGDGALSLPRGAAMDRRDRLHVADAVQQAVKVYDVSGLEPKFLYAFGDWGEEEGQFNFPSDIALDGTGRLYVADRENNRIQVWSY